MKFSQTLSAQRLRIQRAELALATMALLVLVSCKDAPHPEAAAPEPAAPIMQAGQLRFPPGHPQLALLGTSTATPASRITVEMPARVVWNEERTQRVAPAFAGRVTTISADVGMAVKAGTVLARLASPEFGAAQADAAKARADVDLTQKTLTRQRELFEAGIVARKELEQAQSDASRAAAELARARARTSLYAGAATAGSNPVDQMLALRAGINGIVVERNLNPGQELRPDQSGPGTPQPFVISDPTSLWVQIDARESETQSLQPGSLFTLTLPSMPERSFEGRITTVADSIDPSTRTVKARGVVQNPERVLRAEMLATARFDRMLGAGVMVPASSITLRGSTHWLFVQRTPGVFEPQEVRISHLGPTQAVVSRGLEVGDVVVSSNVLLLARQFRMAQEVAKPGAGAAASASASAPAAAPTAAPNAATAPAAAPGN